MKETTLQTIVDFIKAHPLTVLSTVTPENKSNAASMFIFSDEELNVFFITKKDTQKYRNLINNPSISFTTHDETNLITLQMIGDALLIDPAVDGHKAYELLEEFRDRITNYVAPISKVEAGEYAIFKVNVDHALLTEYKQEDITEGVSRLEYMR